MNSGIGQKKCFFGHFFLTIFYNMLKYQYVSQKANINRQQAKMTFQYAFRKLQRSKDLEPAGPAKLVLECLSRGSKLQLK